MSYVMKMIQMVVVSLIFGCITTVGCSNVQREITMEEINAANEIMQQNLTANSLENITAEVLTKDIKEKFKAIKKVYKTSNNEYIFVSEPVAYNGPVVLVIVINGQNNRVKGMRIVKHVETEHYVRDMESPWFTDRFNDKTVNQYLEAVKLEKEKDNDVITITGATVTTQGIVNGVNAAMGAYKESVLKEEAEPVELMVKGFVGAAE